MKIPTGVKILALVLGATLFYTWVGQLVPQKEVQPPQVVELAQDMTTSDLVEVGKGIFEGKGLCNTCHTIGKSGGALRFPDLEGVATRAANRVPGLDQVGYLAQSLYHPNDFIVPGFSPGMPVINKPPVGLSDDEILAVIAYLQTLGGEPTMTVDTVLPYSEGAEAGAPTAGGAAVAQAAEAATEATTSEAGAASGAEALLARYGCTECHATAPGGEQTLAGIGGRLSRTDIQGWLTDHDPPLPATYTGRVTLAEVRAMTDYLSTLTEQGGAG